jgi:hypothetical protein
MLGAGMLYFKLSMKEFVWGVILLSIFGAGLVYYVSSNPDLTDRVQNGFARVSTGVNVLTNREEDSGRVGLETRQGWQREGLKGWYVNPVFGHGVEGFRAEFGITSHSTPIDLLYNAGLIGFGLFYAMLASIAWRLLRAHGARWRGVRGRIAVFLFAYTFISLSGLIYYEQFLAIFIGVSAGLLVRLENAEETGADWTALPIGAAVGSAAKT